MSFLPLENPVGFGASDVIELVLVALLAIGALVWRSQIGTALQLLSGKTAWSMLLLALFPVALRLALLPHHPIPSPDIYDEFGHLLVADTLRHFRLANPAHPLHQFFETFFVLQQPTYSSIYPLGQGIVLALGRMIFGQPWAGVVLATAAFCSLTYWMLRGWTSPEWALAGGILAVIEFGPLCQWMNSYWGGAVAAAGGCLVFGALPRLRSRPTVRDAILLGLGIAINVLTRPFESIFLFVSVIVFLLPVLRVRGLAKCTAIAAMVSAPALGLSLLQNQRVTGSWTTLPYTLSQYQYGVPASLTFQADAIPHVALTPQQRLEYESQLAFRGSGPETLTTFLLRLEYRVRFYRFFFLAPLFVAIPFFFISLREPRFCWVAGTLMVFAIGTNFFPAFQLHYLAAVTCLFILVSVIGLERLSLLGSGGREAARLLFLLCCAHFVFWYGLHLFDDSRVSAAMGQYETWDAINHRNPERRRFVNQILAEKPGKLLVFVRYWPQHMFQDEWVYNEADIDGSRIVWARDLGPEENAKLRAYYPDRAVWLLEPDARPPRLSEFP